MGSYAGDRVVELRPQMGKTLFVLLGGSRDVSRGGAVQGCRSPSVGEVSGEESKGHP